MQEAFVRLATQPYLTFFFVPAGTCLCGSVHLTNNMHLSLEAGAVILGAPQAMNACDPTEPWQGSEAYFLGTLVGSASDVIVATTGRMEAEADIRGDFFRFVRVDSSAVVKMKFGVAGDSYFEITRGEGQPLPEKNASIVCKDDSITTASKDGIVTLTGEASSLAQKQLTAEYAKDINNVTALR